MLEKLLNTVKWTTFWVNFIRMLTESLAGYIPPMDWAIQSSQTTFRVHLQNSKTSGKRQRKVFHFDRLKPCSTNVRLHHNADSSSAESEATSTSDNNISLSCTPNIGESLELVEENDTKEHST